MQVLVIDEWIPLPLESGKKIRSFHLLAPLAQRHDITYLCNGDPIIDANKISLMEQAGFNVQCVRPTNRFHSYFSLAAGVASNFFLRTPLSVRKHHSRRFQQALSDLLSRQIFDVVHFEWTHYAQYMPIAFKAPRYLSSHNVECMQWQRFAQVQTNPFRRGIINLEWLKMRNFEQNVIPSFDHVSVVSDEDARFMQSNFGVRSVDVIPNGVDTAFYRSFENYSDETSLVFCASMDAFVNQDAALYFAKNILPIIHAKKPQIRFIIVGHNPPPAISKLATDRITVTGSVIDVRPLLAKATISVVPLRIGGGSRLKILESFAAGIPVVSTSIGCEGLHVCPGVHLLIADDDHTFADHCIKLLDEQVLRNRLTESAHAFVCKNHDWIDISPLVESAWHQTRTNYFADKRKRIEALNYN